MRPQDRELVADYGEAMLYSHLVEDMLKLILRDAAFFRVNGYEAPKIQPWRLEEIIDEFGRAFPDAGALVEEFHLLRKIRNKLTHALVPQVGSDLLTEEGRDQIQAMLQRYARHVAARRRILGSIYESIVKGAVSNSLMRIPEREEEVFDGRVVKSDIQNLLDELEQKMGEL